MPCFLSSRKRSNFLVLLSGGDPGGDCGISKLGTGGIVRLRSVARDSEYGEKASEGASWSASRCCTEGIVGPNKGPDSSKAVAISEDLETAKGRRSIGF